MKIKGLTIWKNNFKKSVINIIRTDGKDILKNQLEGSLKANVDAFDNHFPDKKESTKKQYRYKGWNTEDWLIRTGKSTKLKFNNIKGGFRVIPKDPNNILKYVKMSGSWFSINQDSIDKINSKIKEKLK